jgi:uncharacterized membrane protein
MRNRKLALVWAAVIFLAFIGFAAGLRRTMVLLRPPAAVSPRNPAASLDAHFLAHRALTLVHVLPGMLFMLLGPLQFLPGLRSRHPGVHRWSGRLFLAASAVLGVAGLRLALGETVGGVDEKAAILLFGTFFLFALAKALRHALRREFDQHREWMIRGYSTGLAVATIRPIIAAFFAFALAHGRAPAPGEFFGTAFWLGFTLQAGAAEVWIRSTRGPNAASAVRRAAGPVAPENR